MTGRANRARSTAMFFGANTTLMRCRLSEGGRLERKDVLQDGNADGRSQPRQVAPFVVAGRPQLQELTAGCGISHFSADDTPCVSAWITA